MEMGQGAMTSMAQLLAEELEVDWSKVRTEFISVRTHLKRGRIYGRTETHSSEGVSGSERLLRTCGAQIRTMLVRAASEQLGVPESELVAKDSAVTHISTGTRLTYGELALAAANSAIPQIDSVILKEPKDWTYIGKSFSRLDAPAKVYGTAVYGIDVTLAGMKYAAIAMSPVFGGKLKSCDASGVTSRPGILKVIELEPIATYGKKAGSSTGEPDAVAVIADNWWQAKKAVDAMAKDWDAGSWANTNSAALMDNMRAGLEGSPDKVLRNDGSAKTALASAQQIIEGEYFVPYLEHATMEPMNCTALVTDDSFEVWAPTQAPEEAIKVAAEVAGLPVGNGDLHITQIGCGFGRRFRV